MCYSCLGNLLPKTWYESKTKRFCKIYFIVFTAGDEFIRVRDNCVGSKTSNWKIIQILVGSRAMQAEKLETYFFRSALFSTPMHVLKKNCFVLCNGVKTQFTETNSVIRGQSLFCCPCFKLRPAQDLFFASSTNLK